jgi:hypothetical protein
MVLKAGKRFTTKQMRRVILYRRDDGWLTAMRPDGSAEEKVAFVRTTHPLVTIVQQYNAGERWFEITVINNAVGAPVFQPIGAIRLAKTGFAIVSAAGTQIELQAADPREARFVNESRCGPQVRGYSARRVIEALLHLRHPGRRRINVTDDRRLTAVHALASRWGITCDDLLDGRFRVRLFSAWVFPAEAGYGASAGSGRRARGA